MVYNIYQGEIIKVECQGKLILKGELQKKWKYQVKLFKGNLPVLEWSLPYFLFYRRVDIIDQNLPKPILEASIKGFLSFEVRFEDQIFTIKKRPLRNPYFLIYLNDKIVGTGHFPFKYTAGYRLYTLETSSEDENENLKLIIVFLLQLLPVS